VAHGWGSIAREAVRTTAYLASFGLIAYFGIKAVVKIEATQTRLFFVSIVFVVAFGIAVLLDHLLRGQVPTDTQPKGEPTEIWARWYSLFSEPIAYRLALSRPVSAWQVRAIADLKRVVTKMRDGRLRSNVEADPASFQAVRGWENITRDAVQTAGFWLLTGLITYLGISAVVKIEATGTRLFLAIAVFGVAFGAVSLLERQLRQREPADEGWPRWYSQFNSPTLYRSSDGAAYSYVVLPRSRFLTDLANDKPGRRFSELLTKDEALWIAANVAKLSELPRKPR
jgi:hypothetical protein